MATNRLKNIQSVTVKKRSNFTPDSLFLKTLIEGDFTISSFRQFQTSITLLFTAVSRFNKFNKLYAAATRGTVR